MNHDVLAEIFLRLPLQSVLILRTVCKLWCDVIDSQDFGKLHTLRRSNNGQGREHLQCYFQDNGESLKLCIDSLDNGISLKSHDLPVFDTDYVRIAGAVNGLICVSSSRAMQPIAICNPILGKLKILPRSPSSSCHSPQCIIRHHVGFGFDGDYKVVQLVSCDQHPCLQANLFSKRTNSWRELAINQELAIDSSIILLNKNGPFLYGRRMDSWRELDINQELANDSSTMLLNNNAPFAYWKGGLGEKRIVLIFDMKNEVFRTITLLDEMVASRYEIFAANHLVHPKEIISVCVLENESRVKVYESTGEGSELIWIHVVNTDSTNYCYLFYSKRYCVGFKMFPPKLELLCHPNRSSTIIEYESTLLLP